MMTTILAAVVIAFEPATGLAFLLYLELGHLDFSLLATPRKRVGLHLISILGENLTWGGVYCPYRSSNYLATFSLPGYRQARLYSTSHPDTGTGMGTDTNTV